MRRFRVSGMTCNHCEAAVRRALEATPGVSGITTVDREIGIAVIEGDADDLAVISAIKAEGYEASAD